MRIQGVVLWAYVDTGSRRNFISRDAIEKLNLTPTRHKTHHIVTVNGVKRQSLPLFDVTLKSLDDQVQEKIEATGSKMPDFTVVKRPTLEELKEKYSHA